ncbi:MAG: hypothetical protein AAF916_07250 [Planctomycetota bacterium]
MENELAIARLLVHEINQYRYQYGQYPSSLEAITSALPSHVNKDLVDFELSQFRRDGSVNPFILSLLVARGALSSDDVLVYFPTDWGSEEQWWTDSEIGWGGANDKVRLNEEWILYQRQ